MKNYFIGMFTMTVKVFIAWSLSDYMVRGNIVWFHWVAMAAVATVLIGTIYVKWTEVD